MNSEPDGDRESGRTVDPTPNPDPVLERLRAFCLSLPDTAEKETWEHPTFRVNDKIFCTYSYSAGYESDPADEPGGDPRRPTIGFKLEKEHQALLVNSDPRALVAAYVGRHGWVSFNASHADKWDDGAWMEIQELILESFDLIAPKRTLKKLAAWEADRKPLTP